MTRSKEFLEGYNACAACIARIRNPYPALISAETVETLVAANDKHAEWRAGWTFRFNNGHKVDP